MSEVKRHIAGSEYKRVVPGIILCVSLLACIAYAASTSEGPGTDGSGAEADLEKQIAGGRAGADAWLAYAGLLQSRGECEYAAEAYSRVLEKAPFARNAQMGLSVCLAVTGKDLRLKEMLRDLAMNDAKLAVEIMGRPELGPYMGDSDFAAIFDEARDQAND